MNGELPNAWAQMARDIGEMMAIVDLIEINDTGAVYKLRSLSFASMGQEEFDGVYQKIVTVAYEDLGMRWALEQYA